MGDALVPQKCISAATAKIRLLFFAESVTLAHLARPIAIARNLDPDRYEIIIACDQRYSHFLANGQWQYVDLKTISSDRFLDSLASGRPVYDYQVLSDYVVEDIFLLNRFKPDIVIGDFRLSLSVSARQANIPYITITNGYWSTAYGNEFPMPSLPMTRILPIPVAAALFSLAAPFAMRFHCRALNKLRRQNGLLSLGNNIRRVYTDADHVLCADAYEFLPISKLPANHTHLGPLPWAPQLEEPSWWPAARDDKPVIYVTLGSSGPPELLQVVLSALAPLDVSVIASSAGKSFPKDVPPNAKIAKYLDGQAAADISRLVICNGGSPTTQQALTAGVPVLALASNMDQFLNMHSLEKKGAGETIRADRATVVSVRQSVIHLLQSDSHRERAKDIACAMSRPDKISQIFDSVVSRLLPQRSIDVQN
ncbi:PGL/p-HBAD biosynthesis glycosyltransferase [soil metagenome]